MVDAFDAITTERPYRRARSSEEALDEIVRCSGTHFDPAVVEAFLLLIEDGAVPVSGPLAGRLLSASRATAE